jgi:hypothetical protein
VDENTEPDALLQRLQLINEAAARFSRPGAAGVPSDRAAPKTPARLLDWYKESAPHFNWDWPYQLKIIEELEKVTTGETKRLMVFMPPRVGKSAVITERYPVYRLERNPTLKIAVGCHSQKLAQRFGRRSKNMLAARGIPISRETRNSREWETQLGGEYRAFGVGSPPTGAGFNLIIVDDPIRDLMEAYSQAYRDRCFDWYTSDVYTRREPGCAIVFVLHRWHEDDIIGRIMKSEDAKSWKILSFPALAENDDELGRAPGDALCPARFSVADILSAKRVMTAHDFSARYQQRCLPLEGAHFQAQWFHQYKWTGDEFWFPDGSLWTRDEMLVVIFLDPSLGKKGSDNAGLLAVGYCPDGKMVILEALSKRIPIETLGLELSRWGRLYGADYLAIESGGGYHVEPERYCTNEGWAVRLVLHHSQDKLMRAQRSIVLAQNGAMYVPEPRGEWVSTFLNQLVAFTGLGDEADELVDCLAFAGRERDRFYTDSDDSGPVVFGGRNIQLNGGMRVLPASDSLALVPRRFRS